LPNYKVFQDTPDQLRTKVFGGNDVAFNTDSTGNLGITSTGLAITPPTNGLSITSTGLAITPPSGGLSITPPTDGLSITSTGLAITPPVNGLLITTSGLITTLGTTDVSEVRANITNTAGSPDTTFNVLGLSSYTFGVVNNSLAPDAQALVKLQISPDATNWLDEDGPVTINQNSLTTLVASVFLKYARVYYSAVNAASAVTLNIFFQGQL